MHPRITVNQAGFARTQSHFEDVRRWQAVGITSVGLYGEKLEEAGWDEAVAAVRAAGLEVHYLIQRALFPLDDPSAWPARVESAQRTLDTAVALGAELVYCTTGGAGQLTWEDAAAAFARALPPVHEHAASVGMPLAVETTNPQNADSDFLHTLRDTVDVARENGLRIVLDVHSTWTERNLLPTIRDCADLIDLVQVSDYVPGRVPRTMTRAVAGDGIVPLERLVGTLLDAGFAGRFDIEAVGPREEDEAAAMVRGAEWLGALLERLGA